MKQLFSEAIKLKDGVLYNIDYHQQRIDATQDAFGRKRINLSEIFTGIPTAICQGLFKCRLVYGDGLESIEFLPYSYPQVSRVAIVHDDNISYNFKSTDRSRLSELRKNATTDEIIIIKNGFVTDGFATNLVFESEKGLFTPSSYLLRGTKRQFLIEANKIKEREIREEDITSYQRIYFINAMIDLADNISIETNDLIK